MFDFLSVRELLELKVSVSGAIFTHLLIPEIPRDLGKSPGCCLSLCSTPTHRPTHKLAAGAAGGTRSSAGISNNQLGGEFYQHP